MTKLDVSNDNHWTQDGQARLDTVKFLSGGESVSREDLDKDYPGFNRTTASAYFMGTGPQGGGDLGVGDQNPGQDVNGDHTAIDLPDNQKVDGTDSRGTQKEAKEDGGPDAKNADAPDIKPGQNAEGELTGVRAPEVAPVPPELFNPPVLTPTPAAGSTGPAAAGELTESPRDAGAGAAAQATQPGDNAAASQTEQSSVADTGDDEPDEVQVLEEDLEDLEDHLSRLREARDKLNTEFDTTNAKADTIRGQLAKLKGAEQQNTITDYLESRKRALQIRGENRQTLKDSGLTLKSISQAVAPAPIDSAMARKTGRGTRRPTRV